LSSNERERKNEFANKKRFFKGKLPGKVTCLNLKKFSFTKILNVKTFAGELCNFRLDA
jgi:hypothetical protein